MWDRAWGKDAGFRTKFELRNWTEAMLLRVEATFDENAKGSRHCFNCMFVFS
jgi:hypothetical protein